MIYDTDIIAITIHSNETNNRKEGSGMYYKKLRSEKRKQAVFLLIIPF